MRFRPQAGKSEEAEEGAFLANRVMIALRRFYAALPGLNAAANIQTWRQCQFLRDNLAF